METEHTPNEFPFSSAAGAELLAVPLTYTSSSDCRQVVFTAVSASPGPGGGGGGGAATPLPLMSDPAALLDALRHDTFVTVDTFDSFAAHSDTASGSSRPAAAYQSGEQQQQQQMPPGAEQLVHAVTELQLQQYVQHDQTQDHHQQQQQQEQEQQEQRLKSSDATEHVGLMEVIHRPAGGERCFVCDSPVSGGLVEIFGEANVLSASKTPLCMKLEGLLSLTSLSAGDVHSDVICLTCLTELEAVDNVDFKRMELERCSRELGGRIRRRFTRTVRTRQLSYSGWEPETETAPETEPEPETVELRLEFEAEGEAETETGKADDTGAEPWPGELGSPAGSPPSGDPDDPGDDPPFSPRKVRKAVAARKKRTGMKARSKVQVADPRNPSRTKTKYIYDRLYACDACGKTFAWRGHLAKHIQTHTGERPLTCHMCGKTFRWSSHLTSHLRRHSNEKPYVCNICGKRFLSGHVFKGHMRTHTDEKPYMCGVCGKQFRDKSNLRTHEWVHSDQRPHRCEPCDRGFLTTSALKVHNRTVHQAPQAKAKKT